LISIHRKYYNNNNLYEINQFYIDIDFIVRIILCEHQDLIQIGSLQGIEFLKNLKMMAKLSCKVNKRMKIKIKRKNKNNPKLINKNQKVVKIYRMILIPILIHNNLIYHPNPMVNGTTKVIWMIIILNIRRQKKNKKSIDHHKLHIIIT